MFPMKIILVLLLWTVIDARRWYTASLFDIYPKLNIESNFIQDGDANYNPTSTVISQKAVISNLKNQDLKENDVTSDYSLTERVLERNIVTTSTSRPVNENLNPNTNKEETEESHKDRKIIWRSYWINNTNVKTRLKSKRKIVKRCPTLRPQRNKLNSNRKSKFLEVFQVVEFEHVPCTSSSGLEGMCLHEYDCQASGGIPMGNCADGYGTCCVNKMSCGEQSTAKTGWFVNPEYPLPSTDRLSCAVTLNKVSQDVQQIRLDFLSFELLQPNGGACEQDQFVVSGQNVNNIIPILCGINNGQHLYLEVNDEEGPLFFTVQTITSDTRLFAIKFTQLTTADELTVPTGCLQYYKGAHGYLESFNFQDKSSIALPKVSSYLNNLNYAMCIERASGTCSVTYTNSGDMEVVNYDGDERPLIPPGQAGVEIFNCPNDWLLISAARLCGDRLNDGSVLQDFSLDAPVTDVAAGPLVVWFRSDSAYVGRGFRLEYHQNSCTNSLII